MAYDQLIVDVDGAVATVRMNNPDKLNALSEPLTRSLLEAMESLGADSSVRAIVLTGEGRGFSAGADLGALQEPYIRGERPKLSEFLRAGYHRLIPLFAGAPKPVIAAVNGVAAGAGVSLALACDYRIASDEASFAMAFVKIGLVPDSGAGYFLPRTIGTAEALALTLTGERIDAATALRVGLVNRLVPADSVLAEAHDLAARLAQLPTVAIGLTKRLFNQAAGLSLSDTLELEADLQDDAAATEDHLEGVLAFLQKRPASFIGK
jgi:2-(1,2-epoxy-1,2-dihydrophenyl)acetyl-CoA isomerase